MGAAVNPLDKAVERILFLSQMVLKILLLCRFFSQRALGKGIDCTLFHDKKIRELVRCAYSYLGLFQSYLDDPCITRKTAASPTAPPRPPSAPTQIAAAALANLAAYSRSLVFA